LSGRSLSRPLATKKLTVEGCRILARQFRDRVEARQPRATEHAREGAALVGHSLACPFDLQVLLSVPAEVLLLGPTHPTAFLAGGALGRHRPAAPGGHAGQADDRTAVADRPCGDRLQVFHPWRNATGGH
jgi:hypothetical protein